MTVQMSAVLCSTVLDSDSHFDNLRGSHHQSQSKLCTGIAS